MKKLFTLVFVALLISVLSAGIKKTLYRDYGIVVFHPDSLISVRAHQIVWGNFWVIQSDSTDTMSMTPDKMTIDSITITDYLHSTDDVRFDSTLYFTDGGADTSSIVQDGTNLKFASDNPFAMSRQLTFVEDVDRTGEGTILFANAIPIGMATPGDCQGMKTEFKYGVAPTLTGGGKVIQGLMLKMTMDQRWKFASANRNADVRAIGVQAELNDSLGGVLSAIYANAYTDIASNKQIIGEHTTGAYGVGMCAIEARTEIKGAGALTVPHIAGLYVLHRRMGTGGVTGDYHAIHIENSQGTGAISGTETAIHFEPNTMAPPGANFDYGIDMEPVAFGTADVRLSSGATVINPDDDTIKITETIIELIGDALLDNVTIDSALTVEGKAVFNDTVMLGDSADKMILPKGSAIELYDTTDTDKFQIYDDGTHSVFASVNPFTMNRSLWLLGDTLFLTDGGADTSYIVQNGSYMILGSDNNIYFNKSSSFHDAISGYGDASTFIWAGWEWRLDYNNNAQLAYISFHNEDSIKVDTTGATGHRLSWTGAGGMEIRDGTGADSARWYDDGTHTTFTTDNDFVLSDDVTLGDTINTILLPKATRLIFTDSSGVDSTILLNDGTKLSITSDNQIILGNQNVYINPGDTLFIASATFTEFAIYASGDALYIHGAGGDKIRLVTGDVYVDCDLHVDDVYFDGNINDQFAYQCAGDIFNIASNSILILGWISPATTEQDLSPHNHDATYQGTMTTADQIAKGLVWKLDFDATDDYLSVIDHADFSFDDAGAANGFTMGGWVEVVATATDQVILSKWDEHTDGDPELREWKLWIDSAEKLNLRLADESVYAYEGVITDDALGVGWHLISAVYDGVGGVGASAGITIYVDGVSVAVTLVDNGVYVGMEDLATIVMVGAHKATNNTVDDFFQGDMGHLFITTDRLSADQNWELYLRTRGYYNE